MPATLAYLSTPYSRDHGEADASFDQAAQLAVRLLRAGIHVFSPVVYANGLAKVGRLDVFDALSWDVFRDQMLRRCDALIVAAFENWDLSDGVKADIAAVEQLSDRARVIWICNPHNLAMRRASENLGALSKAAPPGACSWRGA